jgi:shikimate kinase
MPKHLDLVGYRGTGKTTVGRLLAAAVGRPFVDLDERIETAAGMTIADIFAAEGEPGFRDRESAALRAASAEPPAVIATGGGIVLRPENRAVIRETGWVAWLTAPAEDLWARIQADAATASRRPKLAGGGRDEVTKLLAVREPLYREVADLRMETAGLSPDAVAAAILASWNS